MAPLIKEGVLWVESSHGLLRKSWSRKLAELRPRLLSLRDEDGRHEAKVLLEASDISKPKQQRAGKFAFRLNMNAASSSHKRKLILATGSLEETREWVEAFELAGVTNNFIGVELRRVPPKQAKNEMRLMPMAGAPAPAGEDILAALLERGAHRSDAVPGGRSLSELRKTSLSSVRGLEEKSVGPGRVAKGNQCKLLWLPITIVSIIMAMVLMKALSRGGVDSIGANLWEWLTTPTGDTCADGLIFGGPERTGLNTLIFLFLLCWVFLGIALAAENLMVSIETMTSQEKQVEVVLQGQPQRVSIRVWNATVANLTLMALGSSAPEIMLSTIEICTSGFYVGKLGHGTIVGSTAFNILVITAVCVWGIGKHGKAIQELPLFWVTASFVVFAYLWLIIVLVVNTPHIIDVWEGVGTLVLFPVLVILAYLVDIEAFKSCASAKPSSPIVAVSKLGKDISGDEVSHMIVQFKEHMRQGASELLHDAGLVKNVAAMFSPPRSHAFYRVNATRTATGKDDATVSDESLVAHRSYDDHCHWVPSARPSVEEMLSTVEFGQATVCVPEGSPRVELKLLRTGLLRAPATVHYSAMVLGSEELADGYERAEGWVEFAPGQVEAFCWVKIVDGIGKENGELFSVLLSQPSATCQIGGTSTCTVRVEDDDRPGQFFFEEEKITVCESNCKAILHVCRTNGHGREVELHYATRNGTAFAHDDYEPVNGVLTFPQGVSRVPLTIPVVDAARYDRNDHFFVVLWGLTHRATFLSGRDSLLATIEVTSDQERRRSADEVATELRRDVEVIKLGWSSWEEQLQGALVFEGSKCAARVLFAASLPWKLLFAFIPPPAMMHGWPCFLSALFVTGVLTAVMGDMAAHMGCCMGLPAMVTAITFIAVGTSLPDMFASRSAAINELNADSSLGTITGSSSVTVFLGLGLPWAVAACYWRFLASDSAKASWHAHYANEDWYSPDMAVAFVVPADDLAFSVVTFACVGTICPAMLWIRRRYLGIELGGPEPIKSLSGGALVTLWLLFVVLTAGASIYLDDQSGRS